ncbi:hypothetical protein B0H16DRAFT_1605737, partial [Mycena metata]
FVATNALPLLSLFPHLLGLCWPSSVVHPSLLSEIPQAAAPNFKHTFYLPSFRQDPQNSPLKFSHSRAPPSTQRSSPFKSLPGLGTHCFQFSLSVSPSSSRPSPSSSRLPAISSRYSNFLSSPITKS